VPSARPNHYTKNDRQHLNPLLAKRWCDLSLVLWNENWFVKLVDCHFDTGIWREREKHDKQNTHNVIVDAYLDP